MSDIKTRIRAQFQRDIAAHQLQILHDDGLYRHLRCADPKTFCGSFNIITWPGSLAYSGDMGDFIFSRTSDMFTFFRGHHNPDLRYWAEKVQAEDRHGGVRKYSPDAARAWVNERLDEGEASEAVRAEAAQLNYSDGDVRLYDEIAAIEFAGFQDHWEANWKEYADRFVWCCFALPFAIDLYDKAKQATVANLTAAQRAAERGTASEVHAPVAGAMS